MSNLDDKTRKLNLKDAHRLIDKQAENGFWGTIELRYQNGVIALMMLHMTIKPGAGLGTAVASM